MDTLIEFGVALIQEIQTLSPMLDGVMRIVTFMGTIEFYLILIPFLYWSVNTQLGMRILMALIVTDVLGVVFKQLLHQPRPYWVSDGVKALASETSYGIPSTHASDSLVVWGYLAYAVRKVWFTVAATILVLLISVSRLYMGVHFPHDVVFGWIIGAVVLVLFIFVEPRLSPWLQAQSPSLLIAMGFAVSLLFVILGLVVSNVMSYYPDPASWASYATGARTLSSYFTLGGTIFGAIAGFVLMQQHARFQTSGVWLQRAARFLVGMVGVVIFWQGLDILFGMIAEDQTGLGYALRYVRYAMITGWATFGAPWVFLRFKLARPANA